MILEKLIFLQMVEKFPALYGPEVSSLLSKEPTTGPYPEPEVFRFTLSLISLIL
jgi:hypothetical protein